MVQPSGTGSATRWPPYHSRGAPPCSPAISGEAAPQATPRSSSGTASTSTTPLTSTCTGRDVGVSAASPV
ncbi:MAG: hypothetical protein H6708_06220 [Kofleriaceae bacterium]|nr:hypothetical protein [Kofleriaceae bacterium]